MTILQLPAVLAETGISKTTIYAAISDGTFTKSVQLSPRRVGWPSDEVQAINRARIAGHSPARIRALVARLHDKRAQLTE